MGAGDYGDQDAVGGYNPSQFSSSGPGDASTSILYPDAGGKPVPKPRHNVRSDITGYDMPSGPPPSGPPPTGPPQGSNPSGYDMSTEPPHNPPSYGFSGIQEDRSPPSMVKSVGRGGEAAGVASVPAVGLGPDEMAKAQKYCKFAASALDYDDGTGAIEYLNKALNLLTTGKELTS